MALNRSTSIEAKSLDLALHFLEIRNPRFCNNAGKCMLFGYGSIIIFRVAVS